MTAVTLENLTSGSLTGNGVFDKLMAANKAHLEAEYTNNRITGADFAKVYLGMLEQAMQVAVTFLSEQQLIGLKADLLAKQIENEGKQGLLLDKQALKLDKEIELVQSQLDLNEKELLLKDGQISNLTKQGELIDGQVAKLATDRLLVLEDIEKAKKEVLVLVAQECKLRAEFDLTMASVTKTGKESDLLAQKIVTEKAQTLELGVDDNSVIGRQKALYAKQAAGFDRDAEQKLAKLMTDTWNARRMTDEGTSANDVNKLDDASVGRAVLKALSGVGA